MLRQTLLPRWVAQLLVVNVGAMVGPLIVQLLGTGGSLPAFLASRPLVHGYFMVMFRASICGSLVTLGALERETLQRQASDARLHLLTAQIEPHFLLNTLANVQTLVETG